MVMVELALALTAALGPTPGSVVILPVEAKQGVNSGVADILTTSVATSVGRRKRFSRVVSAKDVENLLGMEKQKQLMDCSSTSCWTEIGAALGGDYVLSGQAARLGSAFTLNLSLVNSRTATMEASANRLVRSQDEADLVDMVDQTVGELLGEAARTAAESKPGAASPVPVKADKAPSSAGPAGTPVTASETPARAGWVLPVRVAGVVGLGGSVAVLLLAVVAGVAAVSTLGLRNQEFLLGYGVTRFLFPALLVGGGASGGLLLLAVTAVGLGAALVAASVVGG